MGTGLRLLANRVKDAISVLRGGVPTGRTYHYDPRLDGMRTAQTRALTFTRLESIITSGKSGYLSEALQLYEEMEQRDGRLRSVAGTRRRALTGLDYEIVSASETTQRAIDKNLADEAAEYVREKFAELDGCGDALKHLATAIGPNLAVLEMEWENSAVKIWTPLAIFPVPSTRLTMQLEKTQDVRITSLEEPLGRAATPPKFVVHIPEAVSGSPLWKALSEAQAWIWLIKKLALSDWGTFCEIFGMPVRVGKYRPAATPEEKTILKEMLASMGASAWAMVAEGMSIELVECNRGVAPFEAVLNFCNREQSVLWLGGNLTSDTTGGTGTFAAANVQNDVRQDLRDDDIQVESRTVGGQIIRPMVGLKYPGRDAPLPIFRRIKPETVDRIKEAGAIRAAQGVGLSIGRDWAYKRLAIPKPNEDDELLEPADAFVDAVREETTGNRQ